MVTVQVKIDANADKCVGCNFRAFYTDGDMCCLFGQNVGVDGNRCAECIAAEVEGDQ